MISRFAIPFLILVLLVSFSVTGKAQDDCVVKLNEAEKLYEEGKIEKIPEMLNSCIEAGFNKENKIAALRLLTLVYLFDDNLVKAESSLLRLLKEDPEYKTNQAIDPVEFTRLYNSFNTAPIFSLGVVLGVNSSMPRLIEPYGTASFDAANPKYNAEGFGYNMGIRSAFHLNHQWDIIFEPSLTTYSFHVEENVTNYNITLANESMTYIDFPIFTSYIFYKYNSLSFYGELGAIYGMYLSGKYNGTSTFTNNENPDYEGSSITMTDLRKSYLIMGSMGIGSKLKINRGNLAFNIRYKFGINNVMNTDIRYTPEFNQILSEYMDIDNDFSNSNISISISYNYEFYIHHKKPTNKSNYDVLK
jgi:hypothetical protein